MRAGVCSTCTSLTAGCAAPVSGGQVGDSAAILEDYATLADRRCSRCTRSPASAQWLDAATALLDTALGTLRRRRAARSVVRHRRRRRAAAGAPRRPLDGATPSGASSITEALPHRGAPGAGAAVRPVRLGGRLNRLSSAAPVLGQAPALGRALAGCCRGRRARPIQIAVATDVSDSRALLGAARELAPGGAVVVGGAVNSSELLIDRDRVGGA